MAQEIENVWDYPRPPRLERFVGPIRMAHGGVELAQDAWAWRVLETSHPPTYYLPPEQLTDAAQSALKPSGKRSTWCEWKGQAEYLDLCLTGQVPLRGVAWRYRSPTRAFRELQDCVALYAGPLDLCEVAGEAVQRQAGDFYGGWVTSWVHGGQRGFKGGAGTAGW